MHYSLFLLLLFVDVSLSFVDPFSSAFAVGTAATSALLMLGEYVGLTSMRCKVGLVECCTKAFVHPNMTSFKNDLESHLYGQHVAQKTVLRAIRSHVTLPNPSKPLVMSFHGWSGVGKNFVARMIVRNIYSKADKSAFVHVFNSEVHFKNPALLATYKDQLQTWIPGNVSKCERSIFIFDEMDHMPEGLLDALVPFLEPQPSFNKVDYRKAIFLFLSNRGSNSINKHCLQVWKDGKSRESITLAELQNVLSLSAFNEQSGLRNSKIIHKHLIDHFVPFLPLERDHVQKCIEDEIKRAYSHFHFHNLSDVLRSVMDELLWFPENVKLYSKSGCKKIANKVALIMSDYDTL